MFNTNHHENLLNAVIHQAKRNPQSGYREMYFPKGIPNNKDEIALGGEIEKFYTFDELGHIMVATTSKDTDTPNPELVDVMSKVFVFFAAWTAAFASAEKSLFDYEAVNKIISKSGYFINTLKEQRNFSATSTSVALDTTIIQSVLSGGVSGGGLAIAKRVLAAIGGEIKASYEEEKSEKKICHLLFVVESLLSVPIVSISLFNTTYKQLSWAQKTNCSTVSHSEVKFDFNSDHYLFVDPQMISKFTPDFKPSQEYAELIERLKNLIVEE